MFLYGLYNQTTQRVVLQSFTLGALAAQLGEYDRTICHVVRLQSNLNRHINGKLTQTEYYPGLKQFK